MYRLLSSLYFILASISFSNAQTPGVKDYHPPLGIPLVLASNFGELRTNHFHMGLDFKTNSKTGYRLYSIDEGYVSRIKVSPYGYGKVIYIDHPDGITSVYAHCSEFKGAIDSIVRLTQLNEQNFEVEIFPGKNEIRVVKGEVIALSGNTGSSTAPHLHFELRDTETEHALNPLYFGFDVADHKAPEIRGVKAYALDKHGYLYENKEVTKNIVKGKYGYYIGGDTLRLPAYFSTKEGGVGLAFDVIDRLDGASNQCGMYGSHLIVNGDTLFTTEIQRIPFESTRMINTHMDYDAYHQLRRHYHKSYRSEINDLPIYSKEVQQGILMIEPNKSYDILYKTFDLKGNQSEIKFVLKVEDGAMNNRGDVSDSKNFIEPNNPYNYKSESCEIDFPAKTVYEPLLINENSYCGELYDDKIPVHEAFTIRLKNKFPADGKSYIEVKDRGIKGKALETKLEGEWLIAQSKTFGDFSVQRDEDEPRIIPVNILNRTNFLSNKRLVWNISDTGSGLADYDLFIDGQWYLVEYEYKGNLLTFDIPSDLKGSKELLLKVTDACGNIAEWSKTVEFQ